MSEIVLFALLGLGSGALTAGVAVSLVVFYRGTGAINLAAGAIAMVAAYTFWALRTGAVGGGMGAAPALLLTLLFVIALGLLTELLIYRPLRTATPLAKLVASLGLLLLAQAALILAFGSYPKTEPAILPSTTLDILLGTVPVDRLILTGLIVLIAVALAAFYRWTSFGLATRAAFENEFAARMIGLSPNRIGMVNTVIGFTVAGALGVLAAPLIVVDTEALPLIVVPALAAAIFARFTSIIVACLGGIALGVIQGLIYYASTQSWYPTDGGVAVPGVQEMVVFALVVIALFWQGDKIPGRGDLVEKRLPVVPAPERLLRPAVVAAVACGVALVILPFDFRQALVTSAIGAVLVLSLVVITGYVGQISVMQLALSGVAGFIISHLASDGIGFPIAPLLGALGATVLGLVVGFSALRVRGVQLAVVTLAATVALEAFWFNNPSWGAGQAGARVPQPELLGLNLGNDAAFRGLDGRLPSPVLGFVIIGVAILLCVFVANLRRTRVGQHMLAVRSNERAAASMGINVRDIKLIGFGLSSFIAGLAGGMYGYNFGSISASRFGVLTALSVIAFAYIGGITMVSGAVIAGFLATQGLSQHALDAWFGLEGTWVILVGGIALIVNVIFYPEGVAGTQYLRRQAKKRGAIAPQRPRSFGTGEPQGQRS